MVPFTITLPNGVILNTQSTEIKMFTGQELLKAIFSADPSTSFNKLLEPILEVIPQELVSEEVDLWADEDNTAPDLFEEELYDRLAEADEEVLHVLSDEEKLAFYESIANPTDEEDNVLDEPLVLESHKSFYSAIDADGNNYVALWEELKPKIEIALEDLQNPLDKTGKKKTKAMVAREQPLKNLMAADLNKSVGDRFDANDIKTIYLERTKGKYRHLLSNATPEVEEEEEKEINTVFVKSNLAHLIADQDQNKYTFTIVKELPKTGYCLTQEEEIRPCKDVLAESQSTGEKLGQAVVNKSLARQLAEERLAKLEADDVMDPIEKANRLRNARARLEVCQ
jgi:hypothetical protein